MSFDGTWNILPANNVKKTGLLINLDIATERVLRKKSNLSLPVITWMSAVPAERYNTPKFIPPTFLGGKEPKNGWVITVFEFPARKK